MGAYQEGKLTLHLRGLRQRTSAKKVEVGGSATMKADTDRPYLEPHRHGVTVSAYG